MKNLIILAIILILILVFISSKSIAKFSVPQTCKHINLQHNESIRRCREDCNSDNNCNHLIKDYLSLLDSAR